MIFLQKLVWIVGLFLIVMGGVKLTKIVTSRVKVNRWVLGFSAPLVLIVPSFLFKNIHPIVWNVLQVIFCLMCIMFFEITRTMLENNKMKGIVRYDQMKGKNKK